MIAVTVNDRPIDASAIVERGRVFLPVRAAFAALGATVSYDERARVVVVRSPQHTLRLGLGDALVIENRVYVPLRTVAQALGASVIYDERARLVRVALQPGSVKSAFGIQVIGLDPPANASVATAYPTISASLGSGNAASGDVRLTLDDSDVTSLASFDGSTITFMPRTGLSRGSHTVIFAGHTAQGDPFEERWSFTTTLAAPADSSLVASSPYDYRFYVNGANAFYPGDFMHFTLIAPPGGSAVLQLCDTGYQYPFWNGGYGGTYEANIQAPGGYWVPACAASAIYTSWNGTQTYVPIPIIIGLYTNPAAAPTPRPVHTVRPLPPEPRKLPPTPAPLPVRSAAPNRTPAPQPRPLPSFHPIHVPIHVPTQPRPRATP